MSSCVLGVVDTAVDKIGKNPVLFGVQCCCSPDKTRRAQAKLVGWREGGSDSINILDSGGRGNGKNRS